jgi:hypothetical protein
MWSFDAVEFHSLLPDPRGSRTVSRTEDPRYAAAVQSPRVTAGSNTPWPIVFVICRLSTGSSAATTEEHGNPQTRPLWHDKSSRDNSASSGRFPGKERHRLRIGADTGSQRPPVRLPTDCRRLRIYDFLAYRQRQNAFQLSACYCSAESLPRLKKTALGTETPRRINQP